MLAIRLSRTGSKKRPYFRLVVYDSRKARDSRSVEILGHYHPRSRPAVLEVNQERIAYWLKAGARPSDTVRTLLAGHVTGPVQRPAAAPAPAVGGAVTAPGVPEASDR
jgi:small subunit ribosomal protein S16